MPYTFRLLALLASLAAVTADAALPVEKAQVVRIYPHSTGAFTEGLLIRDGFLYESTGREGQSDIRKIDLATGRTAPQRMAPRSRSRIRTGVRRSAGGSLASRACDRAPGWTRTSGLGARNAALSPLSYEGWLIFRGSSSAEPYGLFCRASAPPGTRTPNPLIKSQLLYLLSQRRVRRRGESNAHGFYPQPLSRRRPAPIGWRLRGAVLRVAGWDRTTGLRLFRAALYLLSYNDVEESEGFEPSAGAEAPAAD